MNKRLLIFGVSGFVGGYLAEEFHKNGYEVYGCDIVNENVSDKVSEFFNCDLTDAGSVFSAISAVNPTHIINLAAISSVGLSWNIPAKVIKVNVIGALNILEAARGQEEKPKILLVGSSEEYQPSSEPISEETPLNSNNPYGISKLTQEHLAAIYRERYGMKIYCARPFNHTGIGQKDSFVIPSFCKQAAEIEKSGKAGVIKVGNLAAKRDFSDVRDIVRAYRLIIENGDCEKVYNIGSGKAYSLEEILRYIISLCTVEIKVEIDPQRFRPVDTPVVCCDNRLIEKELGWTAEHGVMDTVREMYTMYFEATMN